MNKIAKTYRGFKITNRSTKEEIEFPYYSHMTSMDAENRAIDMLMQLTKLDRANFWISGLIKK